MAKKILKILSVGLLFACLLQGNYCLALENSDSTWLPESTSQGMYAHDFNVDYYLTRDENGVSHMHVVETIDVTFSEENQSHGLVRVIPFTNQDGQNLTTASDFYIDVKATRNGDPENIADIEANEGYFRVLLGNADEYVYGDYTYVLEYDFEDIITNQSGDALGGGITKWQELYWDTNGNDWTNTFENITATLHMDKELASKYLHKNACYVGKYGANGSTRCTISENANGTEISFSASEIDSYENLSFVLAFEPGTFVIPETQKNYAALAILIIVLIGGMIIVLVAVRKYNKVKAKKAYYKNMFVKPEYAPPANLTVAEMAKVGLTDVIKGTAPTATMIELAISQKIAIHKQIKDGILKDKNIWTIEVLNIDILPEQKNILRILKGNGEIQQGDKFELKKQKYDRSLARYLEKFETEAEKRLQELGLFEPDDKSKKFSSGGAKTLAIIWSYLVLIFGVPMLINSYKPYLPLFGGIPIIIGIVLVTIAAPVIFYILTNQADKYAQRTEKGLEMARYLEGMKLYVKMAESERIKFLQSVDGADVSNQGIVKIYEKLLPYAVIFGLEKSWLGEMSKYYEYDDVSNPSWYVGAGAFAVSDFSNSVSEISSLAASSITHSTTNSSSSSSSGFSGGSSGGSGGGGGGGGGGSW